MGRKNKIRMPSSEGGIVRYFDEEYQSKIMLRPEYVIVAVVAVAIIAVILRFI